MPTIAQQLQELAQIKADLKDAINAKGVTVLDSDAFNTYATKVSQIYVSGVNPIYYWDFTSDTDPLIDKLQNKVATQSGGTFDSNGFSITTTQAYMNLNIPMRPYVKVELEIGNMENSGISHNGSLIGFGTSGSVAGLKLLTASGYWAVWTNQWENVGIGGNGSYFANSKLTFELDVLKHVKIYKDDVLLFTSSTSMPNTSGYNLIIGESDNYNFRSVTVKSLKYYELEH